MEESGLFELIKTMSPAEKRYFKKYASAHGPARPQSVLLFEALEKPAEYNDADFKKNNGKQKFFRNLPSEKQHLMKVLLQSLNEFHRNNSSRSAIHFHLDSFELLFEKRQYKLCEKHLIKATKLSRTFCHYSFLPQIYRAFGKLYQHSGNNEKLGLMLKELEHEKAFINTRIQNEVELILAEYRSFHTSRLLGYPRTQKARAVYADIFKSSEKLPLDGSIRKEKLNQLLIANFYLDTFPDKKPLMRVRREWVQLAEADPAYALDNRTQYLVSLNNLANSYDELGMHKELDGVLEKIISYPKKSLDEEVRTFIYYYNLKLVGLIIAGEFAACVKLIPQAEEQMTRLWRWFSPEYKLSFRYLFAYGYFGAQQYSLSLKWIREILHSKETLEEYYNFARIFILLIYFELNYEGLLTSELRSARRYFNKKNKLFSLEKIMLDFMKSALKPEGILVTKNEFRQLKEKITALKKSPYEQQLFSLFDWEAWASGKAAGKSFAAAVGEKSSVRE